VTSDAGTVAASYWFGGESQQILESRPHTMPYLLRVMASDLLTQARAGLVRAARHQTKAHFKKPVAMRRKTCTQPREKKRLATNADLDCWEKEDLKKKKKNKKSKQMKKKSPKEDDGGVSDDDDDDGKNEDSGDSLTASVQDSGLSDDNGSGGGGEQDRGGDDQDEDEDSQGDSQDDGSGLSLTEAESLSLLSSSSANPFTYGVGLQWESVEVDLSNAASVAEAMQADPEAILATLGKHTQLRTMLTVLPQAVALNPKAFVEAVERSSPWGIELLVGCWALAEDEVESAGQSGGEVMEQFYDGLFSPISNAFGPDAADEVRAMLVGKQSAFGARIMPFLLGEIGVLETTRPVPPLSFLTDSNLGKGTAASSSSASSPSASSPASSSSSSVSVASRVAGTSNDSERVGFGASSSGRDLTEIRSLLNLLSDHRLFASGSS